MKRKLHITIPSPCHERWDTMDATECGAFCHSCHKEVIDFSAMTDAQVIQWLDKNDTGCGRFRRDQLERDIVLPKANNTMLRWKVLLVGLLPAFSLAPLAARATLRTPIDQTSQKSKADTATAKVDTTTAACDTLLTGVCGRVVDENNESLPRAVVRVLDSTGHVTEDLAVVDEDGSFVLAQQHEGTIMLRVTLPGYETQVLTGVKVGHPYLVFKMKAQEVKIESVVTHSTGIISLDRPSMPVKKLTPVQKIRHWFYRTFHRIAVKKG